MQIADLALQRNKYRHLSDDEWRWFLQQEEGRLRTKDKLPTFASFGDWWYPVRLSCEQCSSELTARYKTQIVHRECPSDGKCVDLTAGYGVDTYFLSACFAHTDYVEQNTELCRIAEHNWSLQHSAICVHNATAEAFLQTAGTYHLIYLDPARRDSHGGKVFRLEDCTPNVIELLPSLLQHLTPDGRIMLKLSPMLDITQALKELSLVHRPSSLCPLSWDVHVVAVRNEVKEVLLLSGGSEVITAVDLDKQEHAFTFTREEEQSAQPQMVLGTGSNSTWLYEPNAAILKSGAYKLVGARFGLRKLDTNTHLYVSDRLVSDFPGRVWQIRQSSAARSELSGLSQANVLTRNYPLTPEQLKKKLHLRDGGTVFVIACRVLGKPTLFVADRV